MKSILPGSTIGVLGSGQLGRMFTLAARRMGYRVHTFSPETDTPTGQVADVEVTGSYEDLDAIRAFAKNVQAVTFEFENVPSKTVEAIESLAPVRPSGEILHITQNRLREKGFLSDSGFPVTPFWPIRTETDLSAALKQCGQGVMKTAGFGYDGKGQMRISDSENAEHAIHQAISLLAGQPGVLEAWVDFEMEVSVVGVRGHDGSFAHYGVIQNDHKNHILDVSMAPADISDSVRRDALDIAHGIFEKLNVCGVLCVEMFVTKDGRVLVNELAPRPHNSGHLTIDGCVTSQFEQQLRAVCGLPLGSTEFLKPVAMANLLGDLWAKGEPAWDAVCSLPDVKLHLYGKNEPRAKRKMGHLTAIGNTATDAREKVLLARALLSH